VIQSLRLSELGISFRDAFKHASAVRTETSAVWVEAITDSAILGHGEGCPRPYVTGETIASAAAFFDAHRASLQSSVTDLATVRAWMAEHAAAVDRNPAAWCAVEIALLDAMARAAGLPLEPYLSRPSLSGRFGYTAVIGDAEPEQFFAMANRYAMAGFTDFKIKLSGDLERDRSKVAQLRALPLPTLRLRVDANNLWHEAGDAIRHLRDLDCRFFAVEEPLPPGRYDELAQLSDALDTFIVLDESLTRLAQLERIAAVPARWIANIRVSKMGGLLRSFDMVACARELRLPIIVGAQVGETSVLTRAALAIAAAAGDALVAQEGAAGTHLLAYDVCDRPLAFGPGGLLEVSDHPELSGPGLGLEVKTTERDQKQRSWEDA
jgi:L-alanine-DL-glutamate epimerase-like enolase superfamily enzyme